MLEVRNLKKSFISGIVRKHTVHAVRGVTFSIDDGETFGIVGNSGCGKSTIARILLSLIPMDSGEILLDGNRILRENRAKIPEFTRKIQIIFQHPESSLDPSKRIRTSLLEPMKIHKMYDAAGRDARVAELMDLVDLSPKLLDRYPHQISGGEAQRIMIVRALTLNPKLLILDEPTSMLDVSIQAQVMNILRDLQQQLNLSYLFISHDLDVVRWLCNRIAVMHEGTFLEEGPTDEVISHPKHPFTLELINSFNV